MLDANLNYMVFLLYKMLAAAKYIAAGVACSGLIGAGAGIDSLTLILNILGFIIILITLVIIVLKEGKGFIEGIKTAANVTTIIATGAGVAVAGNSRDDREDRKQTEAEEVEERKKQTEAEKAIKEENAKKFILLKIIYSHLRLS